MNNFLKKISLKNLFSNFKKSHQVNLPKPKSFYVKVDHHIYDNGKKFRVRAEKNGFKYSKYFTKIDDAKTFRNTILNELHKVN